MVGHLSGDELAIFVEANGSAGAESRVWFSLALYPFKFAHSPSFRNRIQISRAVRIQTHPIRALHPLPLLLASPSIP